VCCSVLQCVAVCCTVLQCVAVSALADDLIYDDIDGVRGSMLQYIAVCCSVMQCLQYVLQCMLQGVLQGVLRRRCTCNSSVMHSLLH